MINKGIYTFYTDNGYNLTQGFRHEGSFTRYLKESLEKSTHIFAEVLLYTDKEGVNYLQHQNLSNKVEIIEYDFHQYLWDKRYWNFPKLMVYNEQEAPFLHMDLDTQILNDISSELRISEVLCEKIRVSQIMASERMNLPQQYWDKYDSYIPCSGILGGNEISVFKTLFEIAKSIVTAPVKTGVKITDQYRIAIEEIMLKIICNENEVSITSLLPNSFEHLQGDSKLSF